MAVDEQSIQYVSDREKRQHRLFDDAAGIGCGRAPLEFLAIDRRGRRDYCHVLLDLHVVCRQQEEQESGLGEQHGPSNLPDCWAHAVTGAR